MTESEKGRCKIDTDADGKEIVHVCSGKCHVHICMCMPSLCRRGTEEWAIYC